MSPSRLVGSCPTFSPLPRLNGAVILFCVNPAVADTLHINKRDALCCPDFPHTPCGASDRPSNCFLWCKISVSRAKNQILFGHFRGATPSQLHDKGTTSLFCICTYVLLLVSSSCKWLMACEIKILRAPRTVGIPILLQRYTLALQRVYRRRANSRVTKTEQTSHTPPSDYRLRLQILCTVSNPSCGGGRAMTDYDYR